MLTTLALRCHDPSGGLGGFAAARMRRPRRLRATGVDAAPAATTRGIERRAASRRRCGVERRRFSGGGASLRMPTRGSAQPQRALVNKVDLLFDIDNSASMGDKQAYLAQAIPDLIDAALTPNCVDSGRQRHGRRGQTSNGNCTVGSVRVPAVHDMHIGIVSSSLGPRLGDAARPRARSPCRRSRRRTLNSHNDDQAHLINRGADPTTSRIHRDGAGRSGHADFLGWFPPVGNDGEHRRVAGAPPVGTGARSSATSRSHHGRARVRLRDRVAARELVPLPRSARSVRELARLDEPRQPRQWVGVDTTILKQRHDFLRPDSLVADHRPHRRERLRDRRPRRSAAGLPFMSTKFYPPRGTPACATNPADPSARRARSARGDHSRQTRRGTYLAAPTGATTSTSATFT